MSDQSSENPTGDESSEGTASETAPAIGMYGEENQAENLGATHNPEGAPGGHPDASALAEAGPTVVDADLLGADYGSAELVKGFDPEFNEAAETEERARTEAFERDLAAAAPPAEEAVKQAEEAVAAEVAANPGLVGASGIVDDPDAALAEAAGGITEAAEVDPAVACSPEAITILAGAIASGFHVLGGSDRAAAICKGLTLASEGDFRALGADLLELRKAIDSRLNAIRQQGVNLG